MAKFLGILGRALYQIIVVGVICLPFRIAVLVISMFTALMAPTSGMSVWEYLMMTFAGIVNAYEARAHWVKTGEVYSEIG